MTVVNGSVTKTSAPATTGSALIDSPSSPSVAASIVGESVPMFGSARAAITALSTTTLLHTADATNSVARVKDDNRSALLQQQVDVLAAEVAALRSLVVSDIHTSNSSRTVACVSLLLLCVELEPSTALPRTCCSGGGQAY